jgi:twinkle protein
MILYCPSNKKDYEISFKRDQGEEATVCPVCSEDRKKKTVKCLSFNHDKQIARCGHCNASFVVKREFEHKKEYVRPPAWSNDTKLSDALVKYCEDKRGIKQKTLEDFKIGEGKEFIPKNNKEMNCIKFPYFRDADLINVKSRSGDKGFTSVKDAEVIFFNLNAIKGTKKAIITEGEWDAMIISQCGFKEAVSVPNGATQGKINLNYLDNCIEYFIDKEQIILATDNDSPGRNLQEQLAERLGKERCYKVDFKDCKDANDFYLKYGGQELINCLNTPIEFPLEGVFTISDFADELGDIYDNGLPKGSKTMMGNFNKLLKFHKGYLTTITGPPNHGKSDFIDQLTLQLTLTADWKGAFYSPENKPTSLHISKLARKLAGKAWWGENRITKEEIKLATSYLDERIYFIKPKNDFTLDSILDAVKMLVHRKGIDFFVIDAWNKLEHKYNQNETKYIGESLDKLVTFCEHYNVHCFLVAHPTKIPKQKNSQQLEVPNLYSISGSANFANKTDNGICVYRDYDQGITMVYVQKVRFSHWGETGHCQFKYDVVSGRYNEYNGGVWMDNYDRAPWIHSMRPGQPKQETGIVMNNDIETPF